MREGGALRVGERCEECHRLEEVAYTVVSSSACRVACAVTSRREPLAPGRAHPTVSSRGGGGAEEGGKRERRHNATACAHSSRKEGERGAETARRWRNSCWLRLRLGLGLGSGAGAAEGVKLTTSQGSGQGSDHSARFRVRVNTVWSDDEVHRCSRHARGLSASLAPLRCEARHEGHANGHEVERLGWG